MKKGPHKRPFFLPLPCPPGIPLRGYSDAFSVREENAEGAGPASLSGSPVLPAEGIPSVSPAEMNLFRLFPLFCGLPLAIPFLSCTYCRNLPEQRVCSSGHGQPLHHATASLVFRGHNMFSSSLSRARLSCACFFLAPGLTYSLFTSRLPAIREQAGLNEAEIGMLILYFGLAALASLLVSATLVRRFGSRPLAIIFTITLLLSITASCAARDELFLACAFMCGGFSIWALADVWNDQHPGHAPRNALQKPEHVFSSRSLQLRSALRLPLGCPFPPPSPFRHLINAAVVLGCYSLLLTTAFRGLQKDTVRPASGTARAKKTHVPVFVICCGLLVSWAYAADGSVAEWGSLYLFSCRGADEETAALAYGAFSVTSGVFRLFDDRLRSLWGRYEALRRRRPSGLRRHGHRSRLSRALVLVSPATASWAWACHPWCPSSSAAPVPARAWLRNRPALPFPCWATRGFSSFLPHSDSSDAHSASTGPCLYLSACAPFSLSALSAP